MLLTSHLLVTSVVAAGLGLQDTELALALVMGVGIDLDHAYVIPQMYRERTLSLVKVGFKHPWPVAHSVLFVPLVALLCLQFHTLVPLLFWLLHMSMDFAQRWDKYPLWPISKKSFARGVYSPETKREWIFSSALLGVWLVLFLVH